MFNAVPTYDPVLTVALTKHIRHSDVHRGTLMDYVGVRLFDQDGNAVGERRFIGLLGQGAYSESVRAIPLLRRKADEILARSGYAPGTHGANAIWQVLDTFPRDELFNATIDELEPVVATISQLKERRQVRLFVRESQWPGRATALVYFPRDRYNTQVRERMQRILVKAFGATSIDHQSMVGESVLARLYFTLELPTDTGVDVDVASLEALLTEATRAWDDAFTELAAGYELTVIAACVIGGVSTAGGIGTVMGALLGVLFAGVINGALPVIHISPFWQQAISGTVILVAVIVNARSERRAGKQILPPKGSRNAHAPLQGAQP